MTLGISSLDKPPTQGILLIDKPTGKTSFYLVSVLRRLTQIRKIGHAGTLDPLATGVMVMLIGKEYTRQSDTFMGHDKEYIATILLGEDRDSYDIDGALLEKSEVVPSLEEVEKALTQFQGQILQVPPMFSAKKQQGKKLYELARKGIEVERPPVLVTVTTTLLSYQYPYLELKISCSSGTYIRSIAHDIGLLLGTFGCIYRLRRSRSGPFSIEDTVSLETLEREPYAAFLLPNPESSL